MGMKTEQSTRKQHGTMALTATAVMTFSLTQMQPPRNSLYHIFLIHFSHHPIQELTSQCNLLKLSLDKICMQQCLASWAACWVTCQHATNSSSLLNLVSSPHVVTAKFYISVNNFTLLGSGKSWPFSVLHSALFALPLWQQNLIIFLCSTCMFPLACLES